LYRLKENSLFGDDVFDGPGLYRPTWNIDPSDKHHQSKKLPSPVPTDILEIMKDNESYTPRARLSSANRKYLNEPKIFETQTHSRSPSIQRETIEEEHVISSTLRESKSRNPSGKDSAGAIDRLAKACMETGSVKILQTGGAAKSPGK
jgi:hypothetical protein